MAQRDGAAWSERRHAAPGRLGEVRGAYERDRARLIHSAAFRRLQAKSQVLGAGEGDFHRTRLTHSMEAAQIAGGVRKTLLRRQPDRAAVLPDRDLAESLGLAHDLGHPPFGHEGERALNHCLVRATGGRIGFEANGQTLRLLATLESHTPGYGLNLTRRTLLGVLKYPVPFSAVAPHDWPPFEPRPLSLRPWSPPKCYHDEETPIVDWLAQPLDAASRAYLRAFEPPPGPAERGRALAKTVDASLLDVADDIAYGTHDLEDGVALRLIGPAEIAAAWPLARSVWARRYRLDRALDDLFVPERRKSAVGSLVHALVCASRLVLREASVHPLVGTRVELVPEAEAFLDVLKDVVTASVIQLPRVRAMRFRAQQMLIALFDALASDPEHLLPREFAVRLGVGEEMARVVADYVSGMTDAFATRMYARLYLPEGGTLFER